MDTGVRIDKWLWAVRVYKTRSLASEACRLGKVRIDDVQVKASRDVKIGDIVVIHVIPQFTRTVKILEFLTNRVSAKLVPGFAEELTPPDEFEKLKIFNQFNSEKRDRGIGRPTKKHRRDIDRLKNLDF